MTASENKVPRSENRDNTNSCSDIQKSEKAEEQAPIPAQFGVYNPACTCPRRPLITTTGENKVPPSENQDYANNCSNIQKSEEYAPMPNQSGIYNVSGTCPVHPLIMTTRESKVPPSENQDYTNSCSNIQKSKEYAPVPNQRALSPEGHDFVLEDHIPALRRFRLPVGYLM